MSCKVRPSFQTSAQELWNMQPSCCLSDVNVNHELKLVKFSLEASLRGYVIHYSTRVEQNV